MTPDHKIDLLLLAKDDHHLFLAGERPQPHFFEDASADSWWFRVRKKIHDFYVSFRERFDSQENVAAALRQASEIRLLYPEKMTEDEARQHFDDFLQQRRKKHLKWFLIDLLLALMGSVLTPIPGPNIFFLYPAARALSHYFAFTGARKADRIGLGSLVKEAGLLEIQKNLDQLDEVESEIRELEDRFEVHRLRSLLEKL